MIPWFRETALGTTARRSAISCRGEWTAVRDRLMSMEWTLSAAARRGRTVELQASSGHPEKDWRGKSSDSRESVAYVWPATGISRRDLFGPLDQRRAGGHALLEAGLRRPQVMGTPRNVLMQKEYGEATEERSRAHDEPRLRRGDRSSRASSATRRSHATHGAHQWCNALPWADGLESPLSKSARAKPESLRSVAGGPGGTVRPVLRGGGIPLQDC